MSENEWPSTHGSLIERLRNRSDQSAWELFVDLYGPIIHAYCRRRGVQSSDAEDVTAWVLADLLRSVETYDSEKGGFRNWLGTIVRNEVYRFWSKKDKTPEPVAGSEGPIALNELPADQDELWMSEFSRSLLKAGLERIRPEFGNEEWAAFEKVWIEDGEPGEVAEALGKPAQWVYTRKHSILKRLQQEIGILTDNHPLLC